MSTQVDLGSGLQECILLGTNPEGVWIRTLTMDPKTRVSVPTHWVVGFRPQDHPELNRTVQPEQSQWRLTTAQREVLGALAAAGPIGLIDDEHEVINGLRADSAGKRRLELARKGYVETDGRTRLTRRHKTAVIWTVTTAGRQALVKHDNALVAV